MGPNKNLVLIKMKYLAQAIRYGSWMQNCMHFPNINPICVFDEINLENRDYVHWEEEQIYQTQACQSNAEWHLERVQERVPNYIRIAPIQPLNSAIAYVVDTWLDIDHPGFQKRAFRGKAFATGEQGHGTHVGGLIASPSFGIQKNATIISVQVLDGNGSGGTATVLQGINWAYYDWLERGKPKAVINLSLGGGYSQLFNQAVEAIWNAGLPVIVAAGNSNQDACFGSPSSAKILVVGATDKNDTFASFSNYGPCVSIHAPGVNIHSLYPHNLEALMSGTSMATPIVSGIALSLKWSNASELKQLLLNTATKDFIHQIPAQTPNLFVFAFPPNLCFQKPKIKAPSPTFSIQKTDQQYTSWTLRDLYSPMVSRLKRFA
jgi:cerevisin